MAKQTKNKKTTERQFGVVLESIDSKFDLLLEGHHALDKKIDKVDGKVDDLKKEMDYKFEVVFEKFEEVDAQFKKVDARFEEVNAQFGEVKDELRVIRNELKEKVSRDEFVLLEKRVLKLEKARG